MCIRYIVLTNEPPETLTDDLLRRHPLAIWVELAIGLEDGQELKRKKPVPFEKAVELLSEDSGVDAETCRNSLERFLTRVSLSETERGGLGEVAFLAFKLHRFISGAGEIFTTLTERPRRVLFEGQLEDPDAPGNRLYPTRLCRECGHEFQMVTVSPDGRYSASGGSFWFIPGKFGFCPCCLDQPHPSMRERSKLAGLSGEGRSSATTQLVSTALEWMNRDDSGVPAEKRKILGFTDNRQDAALQAGHFNDFLFVSLLRGAMLRAVIDAGDDGMTEDEFGLRVVRALGFTASNKDARIHWMLDSEAGAVVRDDAQRALAKVLAHRVWTDLRRGWRYTNPSLAVLKLIDVQFVGLDEIAEDRETLAAILPDLGAIDVAGRKKALREI